MYEVLPAVLFKKVMMYSFKFEAGRGVTRGA